MQHAQLHKWRGVIIVGVVFAIVCAVWWPVVRAVLGLCTGAGTAAFLLLPAARLLERRMSRGMAAALSMFAYLLAAVVAIAAAAPAFTAQLNRLYMSLPRLIEHVRSALAQASDTLGEYGLDAASVLPTHMPDITSLTTSPQAGELLNRAIDAAGGIAAFLGQASIALVLAYYFLKDRERIALQLELCIPQKARPLALRMARAASYELSCYVRGQLLASGVVGALSSIGLAIAGIPSFLVLGLLCGILNIVPYFGGILGAIPALLMTLEFGVPRLITVAAILFAIQQLQSLVIAPRIMNRTNRLHPIIVMLCLFAGGVTYGVAGMLFAIPVALTVRATLAEYARHRAAFAEK